MPRLGRLKGSIKGRIAWPGMEAKAFEDGRILRSKSIINIWKMQEFKDHRNHSVLSKSQS